MHSDVDCDKYCFTLTLWPPQVYHVCSGNQKFSFLCPKGTLFNQDTSVCQWWFTVDCARQSRRLAEVRGLSAG